MSLLHDFNRWFAWNTSRDARLMNAASGTTPTRLRCWLWIDGVGGYLVCLGDELSIGQPVAGAPVDIPLLGDLSRRHATLVRDGDGYLLRPIRAARVMERDGAGESILADGQTIELSGQVRLRFRRPHPLSHSARLEFQSGHGTQPRSDAVLLWADTLVLGPTASAHVVCPGWPREVVLYRQGEQLMCHAPGEFTVDGQACRDRAALGATSRVSGPGFSFAFEAA
ncbi:MAG: FHA domain-containing protein [Planctomycetes bacterium]|nr:FHA domain-containing protein [Planctomycetota bacterium]